MLNTRYWWSVNALTDVYDIHFELSNEDRMDILMALIEKPLNLTGLSTQLNLKNQETSRHLSRLNEAGLISKTPDATYNVTPFGKLCLLKNDEMVFLVKHRAYFNTHSVNELPAELVAKIGVLSNSTFIDDTMVSFQTGKRIIDEAEKSIWRLTDQFMLVLLDHIVAATERGAEYKMIYPVDIQLPPDAKSTVRLRKARDKRLFFSHTHEDIKAFMIMSEKEVILSFPKPDGKFDYTGFNSTDKTVLKWCRDLFEFYWEGRLPPIRLWADISYDE